MPNTREKLIDAIEKEKPYIPTEDYEVGYNNGLTMAQAIVTKLCAEEAKWIPVTERLPEMWQNVLTVRTNGKFRFDFVGSLGVWYEDVIFVGYPVTHWMPLPEPPKGE